MTKIKLCGLTRPEDIDCANDLCPDYIGFVFVKGRRRYTAPEAAAMLKARLRRGICAVGVFIDEDIKEVSRLLREGVIDAAQLHGDEDDAYIRALRKGTGKPVIKAFQIRSARDAEAAEKSKADIVLLDSGTGSGRAFDHALISGVRRPYFLAGGLDAGNVAAAIKALHPYAVDVSTGIETDGHKDFAKAAAFVDAVRKENRDE